MTVPFGTVKRAAPSEATREKPAEPSVALTVMAKFVAL
jgi:hypothetical protein